MAESKPATAPKKQRKPISPAAIVIALVAGVGLVGFAYLDYASKKPAPAPPPLTGPAKAYVRNLKLSGVDMQAHESYMHQSVVEITGQLENTGDRVLKRVVLNCVFYGVNGEPVLRERVPIVTEKMGGLAPTERKNFRLPFDSVPDTWNQAMPQMVIASIDFV